MAKKAKDNQDPAQTETQPGSGDVAANENPNANTELDQAQVDTLEETLDEQPDTVPENETASPTTEADLTRAGDETQTVPAGSADASADASADSPHNGTTNTHPQSPVHEGDLSEADQKAVYDEYNQPGAVIGTIAAKYNITPARVEQIVDEQNGVPEDERNF